MLSVSAVRSKWNAYRECHWLGHQCLSVSVMSGTEDHRLIESPLRSPWRIERSSVMAVESIRGSVELLGLSEVLGVLGRGGDSQSQTHCGWLMGLWDMVYEEACGQITCNLRGTWLALVSCGTSGEVVGRLGEEKVGVTAGIVTLRLKTHGKYEWFYLWHILNGFKISSRWLNLVAITGPGLVSTSS